MTVIPSDRISDVNPFFSWQKEGGCLVQDALSSNGALDIDFLGGKLTSKEYIEVLDSLFLPIAETPSGRNYLYQQDNAPIHRSRFTKNG